MPGPVLISMGIDKTVASTIAGVRRLDSWKKTLEIALFYLKGSIAI